MQLDNLMIVTEDGGESLQDVIFNLERLIAYAEQQKREPGLVSELKAYRQGWTDALRIATAEVRAWHKAKKVQV